MYLIFSIIIFLKETSIFISTYSNQEIIWKIMSFRQKYNYNLYLYFVQIEIIMGLINILNVKLEDTVVSLRIK